MKNDFILSRDTVVKSVTSNKNYISFITKVFKDDYSIMKDIFCGVFENNIVQKGTNVILSTNYDVFNSIGLGLERKTGENIQGLLDKYFKPEVLDGENMYFNDKTGEKEVVYRFKKLEDFQKYCVFNSNDSHMT